MQEHRGAHTDRCFSSSAWGILEGQAEGAGEEDELLAGAWQQQQQRQEWSSLLREPKRALCVSAGSGVREGTPRHAPRCPQPSPALLSLLGRSR